MPVRYEVRDKVAVITLDRPDAMNRFDAAMHLELSDTWRRFRDDPAVFVAVLTGAGERAFCTGAEAGSHQGAQGHRGPGVHLWDTRHDWDLQGGLEVWKPIVCAINGHCIAEGLTLALACDLRICSERAVFQYPEVTQGVPTIAGAIRAPRVIGLGAALELLLIGDIVTARRALEMGLVNRVVKPEAVLSEALKLAERLARNAPQAMAATKEMAVRSAAMPFADALRMGEAFRKLVYATEDAQEGQKAAAEKRTYPYRGV